MKQPIYILFSGILLLNFFSCSEDEAVGYVDYAPQIAVEGWIENGAPASVLLSWTASFNHELDTTYLLQHVIKSAKVSVSDGEQTEVLTLGADNRYLPPYIYYGNSLKGETGKSYSLKIEYNDGVLSAETFIPEPVPLDSCWFVKESPADTTGYVHLKFRNTSDVYYQVATKVNAKETVFTPCLYGNFPANQYKKDETVSMQINKGPILYPKMQFDTYFKAGDTIELKFRTQSMECYDFWISWQNEVLNAQNPIFPANTNLKSNIKGGIGSWCGYGTSNYRIETNF
ncbi:MAG: DUF4249 domain-containing protein [Candidatus Symbiothrix sp.]|jgi:hypothetical protein|nr:DUF4249 domain-containing protein [Candidatus Symbiothrix sp.]